ncbi:MAG: hypothetical protein H7Y31_04640 [Chitinophagaceae bacterium]|nr:hypothetical protein [Chitinophagaceae bacterium]
MSFDDLHLSPAMIISLYSNVLVSLNENVPQTVEPKPEQAKITEHITASSVYPITGKNQRYVTVLVRIPGKENIADREHNFLMKMMEACKIGIDDIALMNFGIFPVDIKKLQAELHPKQVLLFGLSTSEIGLPVNFPEFKLQSYDGITYLRAPSLTDLNKASEEGKLLKTKLWVCLRELFQV